MNQPSQSRPGDREAPTGAKGFEPRERAAATGDTPATDMQAEDAGTAESGNGGHVNAAESAMKQEHKTGRESGSRR